ncbi:Putative multidrug resistance-associated protein lethal(2)03659 [Acromyrmex echinatior]|uniref:Putative multidrug resistance-associated protein lethal(2)03659 n=1 Tax=Acromyrmex echinatior TaxID=103372 RepID=F4W7R5_ACREC|nr:Putative multidrug resistance-associated protein lethal(2)03659 [Acromyrmex echinatior]
MVGRIGAGKSSLISALFRLFNEGLKGELKISRTQARASEPVLFSENLHYNLDPSNQYDDLKLWEVLRQVKLKCYTGPLDIFSGGHNFNVSQRQLICLVRAILRNNRLFVLNEAMANIDSHTDAFQDTIRSSFKECTVITIAHHLNTIIDSNPIIVMGNSSIVEFGCPYKLLYDKSNDKATKFTKPAIALHILLISLIKLGHKLGLGNYGKDARKSAGAIIDHWIVLQFVLELIRSVLQVMGSTFINDLKMCLHKLAIVNDTLEVLGAPKEYQRLHRELHYDAWTGCPARPFTIMPYITQTKHSIQSTNVNTNDINLARERKTPGPYRHMWWIQLARDLTPYDVDTQSQSPIKLKFALFSPSARM